MVSAARILRQLEILLRVDFHVISRRIGMRHLHARLDHLLKQVDEIGLLENRRFAKRLAGVKLPGSDDNAPSASPRRARENFAMPVYSP